MGGAASARHQIGEANRAHAAEIDVFLPTTFSHRFDVEPAPAHIRERELVNAPVGRGRVTLFADEPASVILVRIRIDSESKACGP